MTPLERALRLLLELLSEWRVGHAVVGGLAVSAWTEPRFTRDGDVCVAVRDDRQAEALVRRLAGAGFVIGLLVEQTATGRIATVRLEAPAAHGGGVVLDVLFSSSGIEHEVVSTAHVIQLFEGVPAPVASVAALIALKLLSRDDRARPQDRVDLRALARVASAEDLAEARRLADLIAARGYARGRDLVAALDAFEEEMHGA